MSGIAGILYPETFQINHLIPDVLKSLSHRGAHVRDFYTHKNLSLGTTGTLIESNREKTIFAAIDGHIFNLSSVVSELRNLGFEPDRNKTAEVLVSAYEAWDIEFPEKIDGEFSIFLFDSIKETLFLIRDRIGNKPLYWYQNEKHFIFASELKAMLATGIIPQTPALDALSAYFTLGYIPQDLTPIQNVSKLLPGHFLKYDLKQAMSIQSYWSYSSFFTKQNIESANSAAKNLDRLLHHSVLTRISPNQPMGCFVSGGLGSSSIAYYLHKMCDPSKLTLFSAGFQGQTDEDVKIASLVAKKFHLNHMVGLITPNNFLNEFVKICWYLDEPLADPNVIATWQMSKMAYLRSEVVFSGMGSDEILAGHRRYTVNERELPFGTMLAKLGHPLIQKVIAPLVRLFSNRLTYELIKESRTNPWQAGYLSHSAIFDNKTLQAASPALYGLFELDTFLNKFYHLSRIKSLVSSFLYFDVKTRLADLYILQYDRLTSAFGLDWRSPFLDQFVLEYLAAVWEPQNLTEKETASFLKLILRDVFPQELIDRPKRTRRELLRPWLETSKLHPLFQSLARGALVEAGLVSSSWIEKNTKTPASSERAFTHLWSIFTLEVWYRLYINSPPTQTAPDMSVKELFDG